MACFRSGATAFENSIHTFQSVAIEKRTIPPNFVIFVKISNQQTKTSYSDRYYGISTNPLHDKNRFQQDQGNSK
jgi:hypothetical protein